MRASLKRAEFRSLNSKGRTVQIEGVVPHSAIALRMAFQIANLPYNLVALVSLPESQVELSFANDNAFKELKALLSEKGLYFQMTSEHIREAFGG